MNIHVMKPSSSLIALSHLNHSKKRNVEGGMKVSLIPT